MNYNEELKNKKTWVLVIKPHRYDEKDNKPMRRMIKFNMPVPPPVINGRKMKNHADDARLVWDNLFAWKYGVRDPDINFMMNVQDLNRAIHVKVNFVSLIEKPPKQLKKEAAMNDVNINANTATKSDIINHLNNFGKINPELGIKLGEFKSSVNHIIDIGDGIVDNSENKVADKNKSINKYTHNDQLLFELICQDPHYNNLIDKRCNNCKEKEKNDFKEINKNNLLYNAVLPNGTSVIKELRKECEHEPEIFNKIIDTFENTSNLLKGDSITDDTEIMKKIFNGEIKYEPLSTNKSIVEIVDETHMVPNITSMLDELVQQNSDEIKRARIKPGQRFMEDMTDKHLDPDVRKVLRVEERLTDDRFHMLRSKYVRMFDKKSLDKVTDVDNVKNYWWCKTYLWRSNGKGVINMGYAIYSTDELYSFEKLTDERTIAIKMEIMKWNKRISNEI